MEVRAVIKLVAFDLDGTIGDTIPLCIRTFKMAVEPYTGHELSEEDIIQTFGLSEEGMIKQVIANENWKAALNSFYAIYKENHTQCPRPFEGIMELIKELKNKSIPTILITGKGKVSCDITLQQFAMERCFDRVETGSSEKNRKSEAIRNILDSYNLHPYEMVYIGDAVSDITACNKLGVRCLSAAWAVAPVTARQLKKYNEGNVFESVELLRKFVTNNLFSIQEV